MSWELWRNVVLCTLLHQLFVEAAEYEALGRRREPNAQNSIRTSKTTPLFGLTTLSTRNSFLFLYHDVCLLQVD
jgi:hypothetical protein